MTEPYLPAPKTQTTVTETGRQPIEANEGIPATASEHSDTSMNQ